MRADRRDARRELREASLELARLRCIRGASHRTWRRIARARARLASAAALLAVAQLADPAAAGVPAFRHGFVFPDTVSGDGFLCPAFADIDGDGDLDAFVSGSIGSTHFFANTGSALEPKFAAPIANPFGLFDIGNRSFTTFGDIDADGDLDAFVGDQIGNVSFFRNTGTAAAPRFGTRLLNPFGLADAGDSSTPVPVDLDGDGDLDLALTGAAAPGTVALLGNLLPAETAARSLSVRVLDARGRATRAGAEVHLFAAGTRRRLGTRLVDTGSGYNAQNDMPVHFGLAGMSPVDVEVVWPGNGRRTVTRVGNVRPGDWRGKNLVIRVGK
jgi:hypothetical protein